MSRTLGTLALVLLAAVIGSRFGQHALTHIKTAAHCWQRPVLCPVEQQRRKQALRDFQVFDPFRNSTEYEEYRPS